MFTAITLVTLATGIGANTAVFSVIEGVLLKPLPYSRPDELVGVWLTAPGIGIKDVNASPSTYFTFREESRVFQDIGLYSRDSDSVTGPPSPNRFPLSTLRMASCLCWVCSQSSADGLRARTIRPAVRRRSCCLMAIGSENSQGIDP
jgi:hypothetical protein